MSLKLERSENVIIGILDVQLATSNRAIQLHASMRDEETATVVYILEAEDALLAFLPTLHHHHAIAAELAS